MKGISPIIAIIIILLITISIAGAAYSYITVIWGRTTEGVELIGPACISGNATFTFRNIGTSDITSITVTRMAPSSASITTVSPATINPGAQGVIYDTACGTNNMCTYRVLAGGMSQEWYVQC